MALTQMPNGQMVDIPVGITPAGMAKVQAQYGLPSTPATPASTAPVMPAAPAQPTGPDPAVIAARVAQQQKYSQYDPGDGGALGALADTAGHDLTFGLGDKLGAGLSALGAGGAKLIQSGGDFGQAAQAAGNEFSTQNAVNKQYLQQEQADHPLSSLAGGVAGALGAPTEAIENAIGHVGSAIPGVTGLVNGLKATKIGGALADLAGGTVAAGAKSGAIQGAMTGAVDTGNPQDVVNDAITQGLLGGVGGAAGKVGSKIYSAVRSHMAPIAGQVESQAADKIAQVLNKSQDHVTGEPITPDDAAYQVNQANQAGSDASLGDVSPQLQALKANLVQNGAPGAAPAAMDSATRAAAAPDRFDDKVRSVLGLDPATPSGFQNVQDITTARKAAGQAMYTPDVMDRQLAWNDGLEDAFKNPYVQDALPDAQKAMIADKKDPTQLAFSNNADPSQGVMTTAPSVGTMQYVTQALDAKTGMAMRAGDNNSARLYSQASRAIKSNLATEVPEFAAANGVQRDAYERAQSTELGQNVLKSVKSGNSDQLMSQLAQPNVKPDDLKIGFADALMNLREQGANPVATMRTFMRSPRQRAVLTQLFEGPQNLNTFEAFMRHEDRAARTDSLVSGGYASPNTSDGVSPVQDALVSAGSGLLMGAAGHPGAAIGAVSRLSNDAAKLSKTMTPAVQGAVLQHLNSDGTTLPTAIQRSDAYKRIFARRQANLARGIAKPLTGAILPGQSEQ